MNLYQQLNNRGTGNVLNNILSMVKGNPQGLISSVTKDPRYQQFKAQNYGKSPQQICQEHGIEPNK